MTQPAHGAIPIRNADDSIRASPRGNVTVPLTTPIQRGDERITELVLRPLSSEDVRLYGDPVRRLGGGAWEFNTAVVGRLLVALTQLPEGTLDLLHPYDWLMAASQVAAFSAAGPDVVSRAFNVAWFFHVSPRETLALPVDDLRLWEREAHRIKREVAGLRR